MASLTIQDNLTCGNKLIRVLKIIIQGPDDCHKWFDKNVHPYESFERLKNRYPLNPNRFNIIFNGE